MAKRHSLCHFLATLTILVSVAHTVTVKGEDALELPAAPRTNQVCIRHNKNVENTVLSTTVGFTDVLSRLLSASDTTVMTQDERQVIQKSFAVLNLVISLAHDLVPPSMDEGVNPLEKKRNCVLRTIKSIRTFTNMTYIMIQAADNFTRCKMSDKCYRKLNERKAALSTACQKDEGQALRFQNGVNECLVFNKAQVTAAMYLLPPGSSNDVAFAACHLLVVMQYGLLPICRQLGVSIGDGDRLADHRVKIAEEIFQDDATKESFSITGSITGTTTTLLKDWSTSATSTLRTTMLTPSMDTSLSASNNWSTFTTSSLQTTMQKSQTTSRPFSTFIPALPESYTTTATTSKITEPRMDPKALKKTSKSFQQLSDEIALVNLLHSSLGLEKHATSTVLFLVPIGNVIAVSHLENFPLPKHGKIRDTLDNAINSIKSSFVLANEQMNQLTGLMPSIASVKKSTKIFLEHGTLDKINTDVSIELSEVYRAIDETQKAFDNIIRAFSATAKVLNEISADVGSTKPPSDTAAAELRKSTKRMTAKVGEALERETISNNRNLDLEAHLKSTHHSFKVAMKEAPKVWETVAMEFMRELRRTTECSAFWDQIVGRPNSRSFQDCAAGKIAGGLATFLHLSVVQLENKSSKNQENFRLALQVIANLMDDVDSMSQGSAVYCNVTELINSTKKTANPAIWAGQSVLDEVVRLYDTAKAIELACTVVNSAPIDLKPHYVEHDTSVFAGHNERIVAQVELGIIGQHQQLEASRHYNKDQLKADVDYVNALTQPSSTQSDNVVLVLHSLRHATVALEGILEAWVTAKQLSKFFFGSIISQIKADMNDVSENVDLALSVDDKEFLTRQLSRSLLAKLARLDSLSTVFIAAARMYSNMSSNHFLPAIEIAIRMRSTEASESPRLFATLAEKAKTALGAIERRAYDEWRFHEDTRPKWIRGANKAMAGIGPPTAIEVDIVNGVLRHI